MIDPARREALLAARYATAEDTWELAFVACAQGRFADAIERGEALLDAADAGVRAQARLTVGSALRQLGRYDAARSVERVHDLEDPIARAHLFISQAADAVGLGAARVARGALGIAAQLLDEDDGAADPDARRARIRLGWVAAEIAFGNDAPALALEALDPSRALSPGWPRHEAKTALFEGVAHRDLGDRSLARTRWIHALDLAGTIGAEPIARVAGELLAP